MNENQELDNLSHEKDALDQSVALNRITMALLKTRREETFWLHFIVVLSILANVIMAYLFISYESKVETTTTTTTTIEQDSGEGNGNNIYQAGEYAQYMEGGVE